MKKTYQNPNTLVVSVDCTATLLALSSVGNEYNAEDVTYGRHHRGQWDDEEDEW